MPSNHVVHQLLTGKKRKTHHAVSSCSADIKSTRTENDSKPCNRKDGSISSSPLLAPSHSRENDKQKQTHANHRYIHLYRRNEVNERQQQRQEYRTCTGLDNRNAGDQHDGGKNESKNYSDLRSRSQNVSAIRQRRRKRPMIPKNFTKLACTVSKNDDNSSAIALIQTFLEERHRKRNQSSGTSARSSLSLFEDQTTLPVLLIGFCVLSSLTEWFDLKQQEDLLCTSPLMVEMILWMKRREALHTSYNSAAIAGKHRDALNRLAKFHEAVEDSHTTSLHLLSHQQDDEQQQRESEEKLLRRQTREYRGEQSKTTTESQAEFGTNLSMSRPAQSSVSSPKNDDTADRHDIVVAVNNTCNDRIIHGNTDNTNDSDFYSEAHQLGQNADTVVGPNIAGIDEQHHEVGITYTSLTSSGLKQRHDKHIEQQQTALDKSVAKTNFEQNYNSFHFNEEKDAVEIEKICDRKRKSEVENDRKDEDGEKTNSLPSELPFTVYTNSVRTMSPPNEKYSCHLMPPSNTNSKSTMTEPKSFGGAVEKGEKRRLCLPKNKDALNSRRDQMSDNCTKEANLPPARSSLKNQDVGNVVNCSFTCKSKETVNKAFNPGQDQDMGPSNTGQSTTDNSPCFSPPNFLSKSTVFHIGSTHNDVVDKSNHVDDILAKCRDNSPPDDLSEILLSQSQRLPNPRRVTVSPQSLSTSNPTNCREQYEHFTSVFSIKNQKNIDQNGFDAEFKMSAQQQKVTSRENPRKKESPISSAKSWKSRNSKRPQSFRQTSLISSSEGWISNQRARNFVKGISSPNRAVLATTTATPNVLHGRKRSNIQSRNCVVLKDSHKAIAQNLTNVCRDNHFGRTAYDSSEIVGKIITKEKVDRKKTAMITFPPNSLELAKGYGVGAVNGTKNHSFTSEFIEDKAKHVKDEFKYEEIVRGKTARDALNRYECEECAAFFDKAVLHGEGSKYYDRDELLRCSRHRGRHTPPSTPLDYWELSFVDERNERLRKEQAS